MSLDDATIACSKVVVAVTSRCRNPGSIPRRSQILVAKHTPIPAIRDRLNLSILIFWYRALRKISFKKFLHSIKHIYKDHKILKFTDILKVQDCLSMYQVKQNNALATSFSALHSKDKHNYQTRYAIQNLLDILLARTKKYGKESVKYQCIR